MWLLALKQTNQRQSKQSHHQRQPHLLNHLHTHLQLNLKPMSQLYDHKPPHLSTKESVSLQVRDHSSHPHLSAAKSPQKPSLLCQLPAARKRVAPALRDLSVPVASRNSVLRSFSHELITYTLAYLQTMTKILKSSQS